MRNHLVEPLKSSFLFRFENRPSLRRIFASLTLAGLVGGGGDTARAVTTVWLPTTGNQTWFSANNWSASIPTAGDFAVISSNSNAFIEGAAAASAANLAISAGTVTIGEFNPGVLNAGSQIAVVGGRLTLNYGTVSVNTLAVGTTGIYTDTKAGVLNLTGATPTIQMASVNLIVNSQITGSNGVTVAGPGTLVMANANTYVGGTTISSLTTLQVGNGGNSGSLGAGDVANSGSLVFGRNDAALITNLINGSGSVRQAGTGVTTLTAENTYTGGTTISSGSLQVGNGGTTGSIGPGSVTNNGSLIFNRSDDVVLSDVIAGTGSLVQAGSGNLMIVASNTYAGTTVINNGTIQVGDGRTAGALGAGNILDNGTLIYNRSDSVAINAQISGIGSVIQNGGGTLALLGNNTNSGETVITAGSLQVGNGGFSGSLGSGIVTNNSALVFNRSDSIVVANLIGGSGTVTHTGAGSVILTNNNTYSGLTMIGGGRLQIGNGGIGGSLGTGDVVNNGTLVFNRSDTTVVGNAIRGTGSLQQSGSGTLTLTGSNAYTGGTLIGAGTVQIGIGGIAGSLGSGKITNNGQLIFNRSDAVSVDDAISGTGNVIQSGTGSLVLAAENSYTGTTTINRGTLQVGHGGTTGALGAGSVVNNGTLVFNRSDSVALSSPISGTGSLQQAGSGTLIVGFNNTYTGGTVVNSGTLQIGDGGIAGSMGTGPVTTNARLVFNRSDSVTVDTVIDGRGSLRHAGTGTLALRLNNTYSGGTVVDGGGTLRVSGGAALGNGDLTLTKGTLAADSGASNKRTTVTVGGNYAQSDGGTLELMIGGTGTDESDQVKITGRAALNGTLRLAALGSYRPLHNTQVQLLSVGGGLTGQFSTFENNFNYSPLLEPQLKYSPNDVTLNWTHLSFLPYAETASQKVVAAALDSIVSSTAPDDVQLIDRLDYDYLANLKGGLSSAFASISPEGLTAVFDTSLAVLDLQGDQFLKRADELRTDYPSIYSAALRSHAASETAFDSYVNNPWSVYLEFPFSTIGMTGNAETGDYDISTKGMTVGLDRRVNDHTFVGFSVGYSESKANIANGSKVDMGSVGVNTYAGWFKQGFHLVGMAGGTSNSFDTQRQSFGGRASGSTNGLGWTGVVAGGYDLKRGNWRIGSQLAVQYSGAGIDKFTEQGSLSALRMMSKNAEALHTQLGLNLRFSQLVKQWIILTPHCSFAWRRDLLSDQLSLDSQFASGVGNVFTVRGPKLGTDSIIGSAGFSLQLRPNINTTLNYTKQVGRSGYDSKNMQLGARVSF